MPILVALVACSIARLGFAHLAFDPIALSDQRRRRAPHHRAIGRRRAAKGRLVRHRKPAAHPPKGAQKHNPKTLIKVIKPTKPPAPKPPPAPPPFDASLPITFPAPRTRFDTARPLPGEPPITIDTLMSGGGIANSVARDRHLQARIIWIDATANVEKINTDAKVVILVQQIKAAGFNTIVLDVKPISGQTIYPSSYAPRLTEWRGQHVLDADFDPLKVMVREAKAAGLSMLVSLNAFSEGHQLFHAGPGYDHPDQQTVIYEPRVLVQSPAGSVRPASAELNAYPKDEGEIGIFIDARKVGPLPSHTYALILAPRGKVVSGYESGQEPSPLVIPKGGALLVGQGLAGDFLRSNNFPGRVLPYVTAPNLVPIGQRPTRQYPLMMNPNDPAVQDYELKIVRELVSNYAIDGLVYDDRLRYSGLDGDFGPVTQAQFEQFVGKKVNWPVDVYNYSVTTSMVRGIVPGAYFDAWMAFRALTIRNYLARVRALLKGVRPTALLGDYAGSWYGEYQNLGSNWASSDFRAGFWSLTNTYRKTGFARLLDFMITGCYYPVATVHQAYAEGVPLGNCVEAAGALSNRAVRDATWTYAGIALSDFKDNPDGLVSALSAACATTQGVMVFDLSHDIEPMWPVFTQAFSTARQAPHTDPAALALVRKRRQLQDEAKVPDDVVFILAGTPGIGQ